MAVLVVGGHSRNIGKTSVVAGLVAALPEMRWTAMKITQFGHGMCSADGQPCDCETGDHTIAVSEERGEQPRTDSGRFLAAGASRSLWVRTRQGQLFAAMPRIRREVDRSENVIIESNSILQFLRPDLYLSVLDDSVADFKASARRFLDRADGILRNGEPGRAGGLPESPVERLVRGKPEFRVMPPSYITAELTEFVAERLSPVGVFGTR